MKANTGAKENTTRSTTSKEVIESNTGKKYGKEENYHENDTHVSSADLTLTTVSRTSTSRHSTSSEPFVATPTNDSKTRNDENNLLIIRSAAGKHQSKRQKNKRQAGKTNAGRVYKKKRSPAIPQVVRRASRQRARRPQQRTVSWSSIRSLSSDDSMARACSLCGHRCCRGRLELQLRVQFCRSCRQKLKKYLSSDDKEKNVNKSMKAMETKVVTTPKNRKSLRSEALQIGSRCSMLSPLSICRNVVEVDPHPQSNHIEVTPEMIYEALQWLTKWADFVPTNSILNYLIQNYPVNLNKEELMAELADKLNTCVKMGIVSKALNGETWRLGCKMMNRRLQQNHVNLFWQLHHDSLRPVGRKDTEEAEL